MLHFMVCGKKVYKEGFKMAKKKRIDIRVKGDLKDFLQVYAQVNNTTVTHILVSHAMQLREEALKHPEFTEKVRSLNKPDME